MKALADTQNTLPGLELGNCDNRIIALDIKDDPEDEYLPDEPNEDEYDDLFYDDDIDEEEVNKADEQGSHEEHGLNEIIGDATNDKDPSYQQQSQSSEDNGTDQAELAGEDTEVDKPMASNDDAESDQVDEPMANDDDVDSDQPDVAADMNL